MKKFNVVSLETGKIRRVINAISYDAAILEAEKLGINTDDNMVEMTEETEKNREQQTRWWDLQVTLSQQELSEKLSAETQRFI